MTARDELVSRLVRLFGDRPVRWGGPPQTLGDFDGNERTLEVFNADAREQLELLRRLRPLRGELESAAGGPVLVVFHTRAESARLYGELVEQHEARRPLRELMERLGQLLPEASFEGSHSSGAEGGVVRLGDQCVVIHFSPERGFDMWLAREPFEERDPDFRIFSVERACSSLALLISEPSETPVDALLAGARDGEGANVGAPAAAPAELRVKDREVEIGSSLSPRIAA